MTACGKHEAGELCSACGLPCAKRRWSLWRAIALQRPKLTDSLTQPDYLLGQAVVNAQAWLAPWRHSLARGVQDKLEIAETAGQTKELSEGVFILSAAPERKTRA